ncbi:MAG: DUF4340 domain-containing protein [Candidatus Firestonebacteria bacterium]
MSPAKKTFRATYIVLGILILLGVYVYFFEKDKKVESTVKKVFNIKKEDLKKFEIVNNEKKESLVCEKIGSTEDWKMVKPKQYELEKSELEGVINSITGLSTDRKLENLTDLSPFELDKPAYTINFSTKDNKNYAFLIGSKTPTENFYYIKDASKKDIYTTFSYIVEPLKKDVKDLRKKNILDIVLEKVTKLTIKFEKKELTFSKDLDRWIIVPYSFTADKSSVENLINKLKELKAKDFVEDEPTDFKKYGLDKPKVTISINEGSDKPEMTFCIGKKLKDKEEDYVKREDVSVVYSIEHSFAANFDKNYNDLREKKLFSFKENDIMEIEILKDKKKIFAKKDRLGKFKIEEPIKKLAEVQFDSLVSEMSSLRVDKFVDDSGKRLEKYGLKKPQYIISLNSKVKLLVGNKEKTDYYAKTDSLDSVYIINKNIIEKIIEIEKLLKSKTKK